MRIAEFDNCRLREQEKQTKEQEKHRKIGERKHRRIEEYEKRRRINIPDGDLGPKHLKKTFV